MTPRTKPPLPPSVSSLPINAVGILCYFASVLIIFRFYPETTFIPFFFVSMVAVTLPIIVLECLILKVHQRPSVGRLTTLDPADNDLVRTKVLGFNATMFALFLAYVLFSEYGKIYYKEYLQIFIASAVMLMCSSFLYFDYASRRLASKKDGFWQLGAFLRGRRFEVNYAMLNEHARRWLIKGFFFAYMIGAFADWFKSFWQGHSLFSTVLTQSSPVLNHAFVAKLAWATLGWNDYLLLAIFFITSIDVVFGVVGYLMTFRLLDSDIKSADPTLFGWVICMMCYPPMWYMFAQSFFNIGDTERWIALFHDRPTLFFWWGVAVFIGHAVNSLCTITFGLRFSNITYRGLVTSGFYRYSKHPQYIAKWITWLISGLPFLAVEGPLTGLQYTVALCCVGIIYYWRARTEENHLTNYPEYVEYAEWINEYGIFRRLGQRIPYLRYSKARAERAGAVVWQKRSDKLIASENR